MFKYFFILPALAVIALVVYKSSPANASEDDVNRIVSVGGDVTEIIYELGLEDKIVAVDTTSYFPPQVNKLPKVGYKRNLSTEGLLSLKPDLIIYSGDAGPESVLEQIKASSVDVMRVDTKYSFDGIKNKISTISKKLNEVEKGESLIKALEAKYKDLNELKEGQTKKTAAFILSHTGGKGLVAGTKTASEGFLQMAGVNNLVTQFESYKPLNAESIIELNPDYLILTKTPKTNEAEVIERMLSIPAIAQTEAGKNKNFIFVEAMAATGFAARTVDAAISLNHQVYGIK